jgi:hypothetical protein
MDASQIIDKVNQIALYTDYFIFASLFIIVLFVVIKLRFKIDKSGLLTLVLHLVASLIRILRSTLKNF